MSTHENNLPGKQNKTATLHEEKEEEFGATMTPPTFSITASSADEENSSTGRYKGFNRPGEDEDDKNSRINNLIQRGKFNVADKSEILEILFSLNRSEIVNTWTIPENNSFLPIFLSKLTTQNFLAFPREIAATLQALPKRQEKISEILRNRLDHHREKKTKMEEIEVAQVTFLLQGLGADAFANPEEKAAYLAGLQEHSDFPAALRDDMKNDLNAEEELGSDFTTKRTDIQKEIASNVAKIIAINKNWGELGVTSNIQPEEAIKIVEILRGVEDNVRKEMLRRYSNDIYYVVFNLPHQYREQLNFGLDPERGAGEKSSSFVLEQLAMPQTWEDSTFEANRLDILLGIAIQGAFSTKCEVAIKANLSQETIWKHLPILEKVLFILTAGKTKSPGETFEKSILARKSGDNQDLLDNYGFKPGGWQQPAKIEDGTDFTLKSAALGTNKERGQARKRNKPDYQKSLKEAKAAAKAQGKKFDKAAFDAEFARTSRMGQLIDLALLKGENLNLKDFSLTELQEGLGGDIVGLRIDPNADPSRFPNAGKIDTQIQQGKATLQSDNLPFEGLDYELGNSAFQWDEGYLSGINGVFTWDVDHSGPETKDKKKKEVGSDLSIADLLLTNLRVVDESSSLILGRISIQGLHIHLNQGINDVGAVTGGYGMNIILTMSTQVSNLLFLAMNSLMTAIDPFMPNEGYGAGDALSSLLMNSFASDSKLDISFDAVSIENIMSAEGDTMRKAILGPSSIQIGGSMLETYQAKAAALEAKASRTITDETKLAEYKEIIAAETLKVRGHETKLKQLQAELQACSSTDVEKKTRLQQALRDEQAQGKLFVAASINDLELISNYAADGTPAYMPAPKGHLELAMELNAPTHELDKNNRKEALLAETAGLYDQKDQLPASSMNKERLYFEGDNVSLPAKLAKQFGMNINDILPGWIAGKLEMQDTMWTLTAHLPSLHANTLPEIPGMYFAKINPSKESFLDLQNLTAKIEMNLDTLEQQKKEGIKPESLVFREVRAEKLTGENVCFTKGDMDIMLDGDAALIGAKLLNAGIKFDKKFNITGMTDDKTSFSADNFSTTGLGAQIGAEIGGDLRMLSAEDLTFDYYSKTTVDPANPKARKEHTEMAFGLNNAKGENNTGTYGKSKFGGDFESVFGQFTTDTEKVLKDKKQPTDPDEWETEKSNKTTTLRFSVPSLTVPSLDYGAPGDSFQIKGLEGKSTTPVTLTGVSAGITLKESFQKNHELGKDKKPLPDIKTSSMTLDFLNIDAFEGNNIAVTVGGKTYTIKGGAHIHCLYLSGLEMSFGENGFTKLHGKAGFDAAQIDELIIGMLHIQDTQSGSFYIGRLADDKGYEYDLNNLVTAADLKNAPKFGQETTKLGANLSGQGFSADGKLMDNGLLSMNASAPDGIRVSKINWHDAENQFSLKTVDDKGATLGGIRGNMEFKFNKAKDNALESVHIRSLNVDYITAAGLDIVSGGNSIYLSGHEASSITNIQMKDLNYKLSNAELTGKITADNIHSTFTAELQSEILQKLLMSPEINTGKFSFERTKEGEINIELENGGLGLAMGDENGECDSDKSPNQMHNEEMSVILNQVAEHLPFITFGSTSVNIKKIDPSLDTYTNNAITTLRTVNPTLNGMKISGTEFCGGEFGQLAGEMELTGKIEGELTVIDTPTGLQISVSQKDEEGNEVKGGKVSVAGGSLVLNDFRRLMEMGSAKEENRNLPDPNAGKTIDDYEPSDRFDFLNQMKPAKEKGGTIKIRLMGGQAIVPIETVSPSLWSGDDLGGYIDINSALDQLEPQISKIIRNFVSEKISVLEAIESPASVVATETLNRGNLTQWITIEKYLTSNAGKFLLAERNGDRYQIEIGIPGFSMGVGGLLKDTILMDKLGPNGVIEENGRDLISLSHLLDYQIFKATLPSDPAENSEDASPAEVLSQIMHFLGTQPFGIELDNIHVNMKDAIDKQGQPNTAKPGDTNPTTLADTWNTEYQSEIAFNLSLGVAPALGKGPLVSLTDLKTPGFTKTAGINDGAFEHFAMSTSSMKIGKAMAKVENISNAGTKFNLENIELNDFNLHLAKRKVYSKNMQ